LNHGKKTSFLGQTLLSPEHPLFAGSERLSKFTSLKTVCLSFFRLLACPFHHASYSSHQGRPTNMFFLLE